MASEGWRIAAFAGLLVGAAALSAYASWSCLTWPKAGEGERRRAKRLVGWSAALFGLLGSAVAVFTLVFGWGGESAGSTGPALSPWLWVPGLIALELVGGAAVVWAEHRFVAILEPAGEDGGGDSWTRGESAYAVLILNFLFWFMAIMAAAALHG